MTLKCHNCGNECRLDRTVDGRMASDEDEGRWPRAAYYLDDKDFCSLDCYAIFTNKQVQLSRPWEAFVR